MRSRLSISLAALAMVLATASCSPDAAQAAPGNAIHQDAAADRASAAPRIDIPPSARTVVDAARARTRLGEVYDPAYFAIAYPGGDVPADRGVCTDVVIRAYRKIGMDLQVLVHEDMRGHFSAYPRTWGLKSTDKNIDHRRVPNLQRFFERKGASLTVSSHPDDYRAGDLVTWLLPGNLPHIGIVSDRLAPGSDRPLILHNIGAGTAENDILFAYRITGHYRYYPRDS